MTERFFYVRPVDADDLTAHRPQHVYESTSPCPLFSDDSRDVTCQLTSNIRETTIFCEECGEHGEWTQMKKSYQAMGTRFATVWQDTGIPNLATGQVESDPKKFAEHLRVAGEEMGERLGMKVDYQPAEMTDKAAHGVTDEGLDATHDRAVKEGRKDSRGRFVL